MTIKSKILNIEGIGQILLISRPGRGSIKITLKPYRGVEVYYSHPNSESDAISFVHTKRAWIIKKMEKIRNTEEKQTIFSADSTFTTKYHTLKLEGHNKENFLLKRDTKEGVTVYYPQGVDFNNDKVQQVIRRAIVELLRMEAQTYLPVRLKDLADKHGLTYGNVSVKNVSSRWGSCSTRNNINLNVHLMRLPDAMADYVLLHELAHITEKNHGPAFWSLLDKYCGGQAKTLDRDLKDFSVNIW